MKLTVKKIDLQSFIEILTDLWDKGIDYIDIAVGEDEKRISILFEEGYLSDEAKEQLPDKPTSLKDLDINDII